MIYNVISVEDGIIVLEKENGDTVTVNTVDTVGEVKEGYFVDFNGTEFKLLHEMTVNKKKSLFEKQKMLLERKKQK